MVSTREQVRRGLGLAAQRHDIETFGAREGFRVSSSHQDVQTGFSTLGFASGWHRIAPVQAPDLGAAPVCRTSFSKRKHSFASAYPTAHLRHRSGLTDSVWPRKER